MFNFADIISAGAGGNPAMMGGDFVPLRRISFDSGEYQACTQITIHQDTTAEPTESFTLTIASNEDNIAVRSPSVVTVSITDDDGRFMLGKVTLFCFYICY